ncbi:SDR family oxidoreductase [Mucilaginibacter sp. BJC16-A38]|uniref:SDR family oxidoreductase n=1 Tax=Mucilaginibacter phenanthrenivorans TaxID=1234842 RepID=UPI0021583E37|nr:SDR family oxidoreductase [Mucilaginibacter phenanthrenivorans]MCR8557336.1 SDR family oxidoreductase [Mucilaginibacter phenanthrenivorans]
MKKVILITGASAGIGLAAATTLALEGHTVYGASRTINDLGDLPFKAIQMDVTDDRSVSQSVKAILEQEGRIDVLINNAGNGIAGPLYNMTVTMAKAQFEVNFFGVVRVSSSVLPSMIVDKSGLIINMSSIAGLIGLPYQGIYSASKFALEGYSQSLRMELRRTGIQVAVVNPGDFKTSFTGSRQKLPFTLVNTLLEKDYHAAIKNMEADESNGGDPGMVAAKISKIVNSASPSQNYLVGALGQTIAPLLKSVLPGRLFVKLMNDHYGLK